MLTECLTFIRQSATAADIETLQHAIKTRRVLLAATVARGDSVKLSGLSPKYLDGMRGTISEIRKSRADVTLDEPSTEVLRRFGGARYFIRPDEKTYVLRGVPLTCCAAT